MADEIRIGEFNPDGSIKQDVRVSVLSGKRTEIGDPMIGIKGTSYFYRLEAQEFRLLYDEPNPQVAAERQKSLDDAIQAAIRAVSPISQPSLKQTAKDDKGVING